MQDLAHRFLNEKEIKASLMIESLFDYLHVRLVDFEKYQATSKDY